MITTGGLMRRNVLLVTIFALTALLLSCLSPPSAKKPYRPISSVPNAIVVGTAEATFSSDLVSGFRSDNEQLNEIAYLELLKSAKEKFGEGIDITDITWADVEINVRRPSVYSARGNVITIDRNAGVPDALVKAAKDAIKNIAPKSVIAVVYITAQDQATANYIADELEFLWVMEGYILCDRNQLDVLRREQNLQISGEVDDANAVSIGKFMGANVIATGKIEGDNKLRRLRLRLLDAETARVIGVASEQL